MRLHQVVLSTDITNATHMAYIGARLQIPDALLQEHMVSSELSRMYPPIPCTSHTVDLAVQMYGVDATRLGYTFDLAYEACTTFSHTSDPKAFAGIGLSWGLFLLFNLFRYFVFYFLLFLIFILVMFFQYNVFNCDDWLFPDSVTMLLIIEVTQVHVMVSNKP